MDPVEAQASDWLRARKRRKSRSVAVWLRAGKPRRKQPASAAEPEKNASRFHVRIVDNSWNTYDEVMRICMVALGCTAEAAFEIAWTVDHEGSAVVLEGDESTANYVAGVIETIGIEVRVEPLPAAT